MKSLMMSLALVIVSTACTTVGSTSMVAKDEAGETKKDGDEEGGLRKERQQALLEALEGTSAK
jgi:hypothetical protein